MCRTQEKITGTLPFVCPPLRLGFEKLFYVFNALLCCHVDDVVQGVHVAQHLHNLFDLVPVGRYGLYISGLFNLTKQPQHFYPSPSTFHNVTADGAKVEFKFPNLD